MVPGQGPDAHVPLAGDHKQRGHPHHDHIQQDHGPARTLRFQVKIIYIYIYSLLDKWDFKSSRKVEDNFFCCLYEAYVLGFLKLHFLNKLLKALRVGSVESDKKCRKC